MNRFSLLRLLPIFALAATAWAQRTPIDHAKVIVGFHARVNAAASYQVRIYSESTAETDPFANTTYTNQGGLTTPVFTPDNFVTLIPGQLYHVKVTSTSWASADFQFNPPAGYAIRLADNSATRATRTTYLAAAPSGGNGVTIFDLEVQPNDGTALLKPGFSTVPSVLGEVLWAIGLGTTSTGQYAGVLRWRQNTITQDLLDPLSLVYADPHNGDVWASRASNGAISYISTWGVELDVTRDSGTSGPTGYTISARPPWEDSSPFREYHIYNPDSTWQNRVKIDVTSYDDDQTRYDSWTISIANGVTQIVQANSVRQLRIVSQAGPNSGDRTETITLEDPNASQTVVMKTSRLYRQFAWGREELVSETVDPDGLALTTTYDYFDSSAGTGCYAKLKSVARPDGSWERYDYYSDSARWGQLSTIYRPWQDAAPTTPASASTSNCQVTLLDYASGRSGGYYQDSIASNETHVLGTTTAKTTTSYAFWNTSGLDLDGQRTPYSGFTSQPMRTDTTQVYTATGSTLTTTRKVFNDPSRPDVYGQTYSQTNSDGTKISYAIYINGQSQYFSKVWVMGTATQMSTDSWQLSRITTHDLAQMPDANYDDDCRFDPVWFVPKKSGARVMGLDDAGRVFCEQPYVALGTTTASYYAWTPTPKVQRYFDEKSNVTGETKDDLMDSKTRSYINGKVKDERDDVSGVESVTSYDTMMRVSQVVLSGISGSGNYPAHADVTTSYTYDAANHVLSTTKSSGSLALTQSNTYNLAGLLASSTDEKGLTTTYSYTNGGATVTATLPNGGTKIETHYPDGTVKSITGTSLVSEYHSITANTDGTLTTEVRHGANTATRWERTTTDWVGHKVSESHPTTNSSVTFTKQYYYNSLGQLCKTTEPGLADTLYTYDAVGQLAMTGLDLNANGTLDEASNDRITKADVSFDTLANTYNELWSLGSVISKRTRTFKYAQANSASAFAENDVWEAYYSDHTAVTGTAKQGLFKLSIDIFGNRAYQRSLHVWGSAVVVDSYGLTEDVVDRPDSANDEVALSRHGIVESKQSADGLTTIYHYDALRRVTEQIDPRFGSSHPLKTAYYTNVSAAAGTYAIYSSSVGSNGQVAWREDAAGNRTNYTYSTTNGQLASETNPSGYITYYGYDKLGHVIKQWGSATYPVEYAYNVYGEKIAMRTFRSPTQDFTTASWPLSDDGADASNPDPSSWTSGDKTTWSYDAATGLLLSKTDASSHTVSYTYNTRGQLATRTWARGVVTTYSYDSLTAEQTGISYSDGTPALTYTYTRLGQLDTVRDATSASSTDLRDLVYDTTYPTRLACEAFTAFYGSRVLTRLADSSTTSTTLLGRYRGFQLGSSVGSNSDLEQTYAYTNTARFEGLTTKRNSNASSRTFHYGYLANSALLQTLWTDDNNFFVTRSFESYRDVLTTLDTKWGQSATSSLTKYAYHSNNLALRDTLVQTGDAFSSYSGTDHAIHQGFTYNARNEVTAAPTYTGSDTTSTANPLTNRQHEFNYDAIGNRNWAGITGNTSDRKSYSSNSLNQISSRDNSLTPFTGTQTFAYDADGNVTSDGQWQYEWDAENRLTAMQTDPAIIGAGVSSTDARRLEFKYDYLGRRVEKLVRSGWNGSVFTSVIAQKRFLYDGWSMIAEYDVSQSNGALTLTRSYTWGLDIARSLTDAGGVGALLQIADHASGKTYHPAYDGNGNIAALVNGSNGAIAATYEYSPYGESLRNDVFDAVVADQPFRFSTKFTDAETGLVYYGRRYYSPGQGRFLGRDPIEEKGGLHLYGFCLNNPINSWDVLGQMDVWKWFLDLFSADEASPKNPQYSGIANPTDSFSGSGSGGSGGSSAGAVGSLPFNTPADFSQVLSLTATVNNAAGALTPTVIYQNGVTLLDNATTTAGTAAGLMVYTNVPGVVTVGAAYGYGGSITASRGTDGTLTFVATGGIGLGASASATTNTPTFQSNQGNSIYLGFTAQGGTTVGGTQNGASVSGDLTIYAAGNSQNYTGGFTVSGTAGSTGSQLTGTISLNGNNGTITPQFGGSAISTTGVGTLILVGGQIGYVKDPNDPNPPP